MASRGVVPALAAAVAAALSCGPDFVFDGVCDPAAPEFRPCACEGCLAATCRPEGEACRCTHPQGRCGDPLAGTCCDAGQVCRRDGAAVLDECCDPRCDGFRCGDDGCGNPDGCGTCDVGGGEECLDHRCVFTACDGRECGDNGHGGSCGTCPDGGACSGAGICVAGS